MRIVIPGGSGRVGKVLARHFQAKGDEVTVLSRTPRSSPWKTLPWNPPERGPSSDAIDDADVLINLTGRDVDCRYTAQNRREILNSRVDSTRLLAAVINSVNRPPRVWINASTATIYRHTFTRDNDDVTGEIGGSEPDSPSTWRFSIDVATAWERAFLESATPATRKIAIRSAMTMSPDRGGVFDTLLRLVRFGLGGRIGSGSQYISWIHERDFIRAIEFLIAHENLQGTINVSSPHPLPQRDFMRTLRDAYGTRVALPTTTWMLEIGAWLIRTETELILKSRRVVPKKLTDAGFTFDFAEWHAASAELVSRWRGPLTS
jgi:uncharacterized protein (TIGR01777 family)